jgi:hypothetical protein
MTEPVEPMTAEREAEIRETLGEVRDDLRDPSDVAIAELFATIDALRLAVAERGAVIAAADAMRAQISDAWVRLPAGPLDSMLAFDAARAAIGAGR